MKRAALLLRCSTDSQDYDRQQKDLQPTAENMGYKIIENLIFGEYVTGKDDVRKKDRESIANLKQACKEGKIDAIFINEVSRLSRDSIAGRLFIREFNDDYKVPIFFRDLQQWTIDPISKIKNGYLEQMLGFYFDTAAAELKSMKTRFASGKRKNARTGKSIGGVPSIGYTKDKDGTIIIDEDSAKLIRIIFNKYLEKDGTITTVGRYLRGINNIRTWGTGTIGNILRNKAYTGKMEVFITNPDEIDENKKVEKFITTIPIIIDEETFNKVQNKLDCNRTAQEYTRSRVHLLQKLIICSNCGKAFSTKSTNSGKKHIYCCVAKQNGINCNSSISFDTEKVEAIIWNLLKSKLLELNKLEEKEKEERITIEKQKIQSCEEEITAIKLNIEKNLKKRKRLIDYLENTDSEEEIADIKDRRDKYNKEIEECNTRINHLKSSISIYQLTIKQHIINSTAETILSNIESNRGKMKAQIKEFIKFIKPYYIANSHSVLEVNTIFGRYYILYSSRDKDKQAYFLYGNYYRYYPKDKKFLVIGNFNEELIKQLENINNFARNLTITDIDKTKKEIHNTVNTNNNNLSNDVMLNNYHFVIQSNRDDSTGVYTFNEMKEKCKKANFTLPFTI